jgi:DNA-directed RNA polymerase sigma subunit (sigma70/sigma32)
MSAQRRRGGRGESAQSDEPADDTRLLRDLIRQSREQAFGAGDRSQLVSAASHGDKQAQERLFAVNLPTLVQLAAARADGGLSTADLVQEGAIGLIEAVTMFAKSGEPDFDAFARTCIGAHMDEALASEAASVRDAQLLVAAATDYERTELLLHRELHRAPTAGEIAEKLEWTVERTIYVAEVVAEARRRHDEELLAFIDPEAIDLGDEDEPSALDG